MKITLEIEQVANGFIIQAESPCPGFEDKRVIAYAIGEEYEYPSDRAKSVLSEILKILKEIQHLNETLKAKTETP